MSGTTSPVCGVSWYAMTLCNVRASCVEGVGDLMSSTAAWAALPASFLESVVVTD